MSSPCLPFTEEYVLFPLLVLKGIYQTLQGIYVLAGLKHMEVVDGCFITFLRR